MAKKSILCICYNQEHWFSSKKKAVEFFKDCAYNSEGAERDRYVEILMQLDEGRKRCYDIPDYEVEQYMEQLKLSNDPRLSLYINHPVCRLQHLQETKNW